MKEFKIMTDTPGHYWYIPWSVMEHHEAQAEKNHGQTLKRLDQRGGLSPQEAYAVINEICWLEVGDAMPEKAIEFLKPLGLRIV